MGQGLGAHDRGEWVMGIGELIEAVIQELGPNATDDEISRRLLDRVAELSDSEKTTVIDQNFEQCQQHAARTPSRGARGNDWQRDTGPQTTCVTLCGLRHSLRQ